MLRQDNELLERAAGGQALAYRVSEAGFKEGLGDGQAGKVAAAEQLAGGGIGKAHPLLGIDNQEGVTERV